MALEYRFKENVSVAKAIEIINRESKIKGTDFRLMVQQPSPIGDGSRYYPVYGSVKVSKAVAIKFIKDNYLFEDRGGMVSVSSLERSKTVYIG